MRSFPGRGVRFGADVKLRKGSVWHMYKRMFALIRRRYGLLAAAFVAILCIALLEFAIPQLTQHTIDTIIPERRFASLWGIVAAVLGAALLLGGFHFLNSNIMASIGQRAIFDLRNELYRHMQRLDMKFFDRNRTGDLMSRVTNDINLLQQLIASGMMQLVTDAFVFVAIASYMLYVNWRLTAIVLLTFPFMFVTTRVFGKRMRASYRNVQASVAEVSNHLQDTLSGIRLVKSFANEDYEAERFYDRSKQNMDANLSAVRLRAVYEPVIDGLNYLGFAAVLGYGAWSAMTDGGFTVGTMVAFLAYVRLLQNPIRHVSRVINTIQQSAAAYERIEEILSTRSEVADAPDAKPLPPMAGRVVFEDVHFAYEPGMPVFTGLNLELEPGRTTALVGSSGSGKTTIASLLARFYDVQSGRITIDGIPITDVTLASLRGQMGIVSQDIMLLNGTIRDNIVYGKPDATDAEVEEAARAANAHDFIVSFPNGYHSLVGERGVKLSGGQKQRLSIARAILTHPRLVVLDEATASLDTESEALIQQALARLLEGRTCLVIAHRLSTIQPANNIYVLERGQVVQSGTHESLLRDGGRYRELYELQFPQSEEPEPV
ncbi:ABC transporter ATP-binding protein/permease [Paenibacillus sp. TRM 82003]|nr:ABC transporter ATP-binding protein/permease [Paenibacillus sp. TRM 82003]